MIDDSNASRKKSFWGGLVGVTVIFGVVGAVVGWLAEKYASEGWFLATQYGILSAVLGMVLSLIFVIIYERFPESASIVQRTQERLERKLESLTIWRKIYQEGHPIARRELLTGFILKSVEHLLSEGESVSQTEYVGFLHISSGLATKRILATSLITPQIWLHGRYKQDYLDYLQFQRSLKNERPTLEVMRIFINKSVDYHRSPFYDEIKQRHKDANIKLGFFDQDMFVGHRGKRDCRDFVLFEDENGKWVMDAGSLEIIDLEEEKGATVKLVDSDLVEARYSDILHFLLGKGIEWE
jgi:uncharacterized membrane protein YeaQ/YmgE (transglycosylase-associated protein family)